MTHKDVERHLAEGRRVLIIPVGTLESHGPHLPLGTDTIIPEWIAERIAESINGLIAPPIHYGVTSSLLRYAGSTSISEETLERLLFEIISCFARHGFELFVILNGHGGNIEPIRRAMRRLWEEREIKSVAIHWWIYAKDLTRSVFGEKGGHGWVDETAMMMAIDPAYVRKVDVSDAVHVQREGIDIFPCPGSVILYGTEGEPSFDPAKSKIYATSVVRRIIEELQKIMKSLGLATTSQDTR